MSSASSADQLADYMAGRLTAEQLVGAVTAEYYGSGARGLGPGERLKPLIDIIERAHPGIVDLSGTTDRPGFAVRIAERPFPKRYEDELRAAVRTLLESGFADVPKPQAPPPRPSFLARLVNAIRKVFGKG